MMSAYIFLRGNLYVYDLSGYLTHASYKFNASITADVPDTGEGYSLKYAVVVAYMVYIYNYNLSDSLEYCILQINNRSIIFLPEQKTEDGRTLNTWTIFEAFYHRALPIDELNNTIGDFIEQYAYESYIDPLSEKNIWRWEFAIPYWWVYEIINYTLNVKDDVLYESNNYIEVYNVYCQAYTYMNISMQPKIIRRTPTYVLWNSTTQITPAHLYDINVYMIYLETQSGLETIIIPEELWPQTKLSWIIYNETSQNYPYLENAVVSTLNQYGKAGRIMAVIGINTTDRDAIWGLLKLNKSDAEVFTLINITEDIRILTAIGELIQKIPWEMNTADPSDPPTAPQTRFISDPLSQIFRNAIFVAAKAIHICFRAVINAFTVLAKIARLIMRGIGLLISMIRDIVLGRMPWIGLGTATVWGNIVCTGAFVGRVFRDIVMFFVWLGQKIIGRLKSAGEETANAFKMLFYLFYGKA